MGCLDHPPTSALGSGLRLSLTASVAQVSPGGLSLDIDVDYRLLSGEVAPLTVTPASVALVQGDNTQSLTVDLADCVRDASKGLTALDGGVSACILDIQLTLSDASGIVDVATASTPGAVHAGTTVNVPPVTLGGVSSVIVSPKSATQLVGDTVRFVATAQTASGRVLSRTISYSSSNTAVATVNATGLVTALSIGQTNISASAGGITTTTPFVVRRWTEPEAAVLRANALTELNTVSGGFGVTSGTFEGIFLLGGLLADEWGSGDTFTQRDETDRRSVSASNSVVNSTYRAMLQARRDALLAIAAYTNVLGTTSNPNGAHVAIAELHNAVGMIETLIGEHFCSGSALANIDPTTAAQTFLAAQSSDQLYTSSTARYSSALNNLAAAGSDPGVPAATSHALVGRARSLVDLGNFAQAANDASNIPATFVLNATYSPSGGTQNGIWAMNIQRGGYTVADSEGTNGLFFRSAQDPRLPVVLSSKPAFDGVTPLWQQQRYTAATSSIALSSGTEAALIRAEASLAVGNATGALSELNTLRRASSLPALTDPGTAVARVSLLFRERAFWLFGTGHRLGDLRRLLRQYGRVASQTFPTGGYHKGGSYGVDVNFPISDLGDGNPNYRGCFDRNP